MKKHLAIFLVVLLLLSLTACGPSNSNSPDGETTKPSSSSVTSTPGKNENPTPEKPGEEVPPEEEAPAVALQDLPVILKNATFSERGVEDSYGNQYEGPHYDFCSWGKSNVDGEYITQSSMEYNTNGQYGYLTGTFFTRNGQSEDATIELLIYADDELVYCSEPISRRTRAIELAVDIGYCDVLRITSRSYDYSSSTNPGIILVDGQVCNNFNGDLTEGVKINPDLVPLTDLHVYGTHSPVLDNISAGSVEDSYGNLYKGIYLDLCSYGNYGGQEYDTQAYTDFVANGEYCYLSGTFFTRAEQNENYTIEFLIYADGELVYSSGMIDRSTGAIDFCVEIGDCNIIRVMSRSLNYTSSGTNPGIILINPAVSTEQP